MNHRVWIYWGSLNYQIGNHSKLFYGSPLKCKFNFFNSGTVPPADTDTIPSSEDEEDYAHASGDLSPGLSDQDCELVHNHHQEQRIFVKKASGGFVGLTPNQLQHIQMMDMGAVPPQHIRQNLSSGSALLSKSQRQHSSNHRSNL